MMSRANDNRSMLLAVVAGLAVGALSFLVFPDPVDAQASLGDEYGPCVSDQDTMTAYECALWIRAEYNDLEGRSDHLADLILNGREGTARQVAAEIQRRNYDQRRRIVWLRDEIGR